MVMKNSPIKLLFFYTGVLSIFCFIDAQASKGNEDNEQEDAPLYLPLEDLQQLAEDLQGNEFSTTLPGLLFGIDDPELRAALGYPAHAQAGPAEGMPAPARIRDQLPALYNAETHTLDLGLQEVDIDSNLFQDIYALYPDLQHLDLSETSANALPPEITQLENLTTLNVSGTPLVRRHDWPRTRANLQGQMPRLTIIQDVHEL
jgi:Leucine-rich repeat (LRR) protein